MPRASTGPSRSSRSRSRSIPTGWREPRRLSAGPLRHHEPRRGARHRDRRSGHAVLPSVRRPAGQQGGIDVRQTVRLARGDRVRLTMPVPIFADNENIRFEIREDGRTLERFNYTGFQSRALPADASALIVADPASAFGTMAASWRPERSQRFDDLMRRPGRSARHGAVPSPAARTRHRWISCSSRRVCRPTGWGSRRCAPWSSGRRSGSS